MNNWMKRYIRQGLGGSQVQELLFLWSWGASTSLYMNMITNLKTLQTPSFWDFYGSFIT